MDESAALTAFGALSNATRLKLVRLLVEAGAEGLAAGDLAERIGASPSRASFHLSALTEAGLVQADRQARAMIYRVSFTRLGALAQFLLDDCCKSEPAVLACCSDTTSRTQ